MTALKANTRIAIYRRVSCGTQNSITGIFNAKQHCYVVIGWLAK